MRHVDMIKTGHVKYFYIIMMTKYAFFNINMSLFSSQLHIFLKAEVFIHFHYAFIAKL